MGITSYSFVLAFVPIVVIIWSLLLRIQYHHSTLAILFIIFASLWFIGSYDYRFALIMLGTATSNYYGVKLIKKIRSVFFRKTSAVILAIINLSVLLLLKYANWIRELFWKIEQLWNLILPIGISFYSLEQIMYVLDNGKSDQYQYSFIEYLSYSTFFPVIISGPILHHSQYIEQLETIKKENIPEGKIRQGIISLSLGYGKKVLIASQLGQIVDYGYSNISELSTGALIICIISYTLQLYFDFSGYCNIVEGIGLMMGFELPINFASPYQSASIGEFWKKWHKTLTAFFTRYVYIPLGGNRKGKLRQALNIIIVFLLSGLWHGASLTFCVWGLAHGIFMIIDKYIADYWNKIWLWLRRGITLLLVSLLWVPFRADSLTHAAEIFRGLGRFSEGANTTSEFYQTILPRVASMIRESGLLTDDTLLMSQKLFMIVFVTGLLWAVSFGKDITYLREKYCQKIGMMAVSGIILSLSVMQFSSALPGFIYEGF